MAVTQRSSKSLKDLRVIPVLGSFFELQHEGGGQDQRERERERETC